MSTRKITLCVFLICLLSLMALTTITSGADVPRMTKEELKSIIGNPDVIVVDVRTNAAWERSGLKIAGAVREDPDQIGSWMDKYPKEKTLVFYCS